MALNLRTTFFILLVAALSGCKDSHVEQSEPNLRAVKVYQVQPQSVYELREYPAIVEPAEITTLSFEISGLLEELNVQAGQKVSRGERVAKLSSASFQISKREADAALAKTQIEYDNAKLTSARTKKLYKRGVASQSSVDDAIAAESALAAQIRQAEQVVALAGDNLAKTELLAPYSGVIDSVSSVSYSTLQAGVPVARIYQDNSYEVAIKVTYDVAVRLAIGSTAEVTLSDRPDIKLPARVVELGHRADLVSAFPVTLKIDDDFSGIRAGMPARVSFQLPLESDQGFLVPLSAINQDESKVTDSEFGFSEQIMLFIFDPSTETIQLRKVNPVAAQGDMLVINSGLNAGDLVVSAGVPFLHDGQKVRRMQKVR